MSDELERGRRVYPPTFLLLAAVVMVCLHFLVPFRQIIRAPYRYLGIVPLVAGLAVVLSAAAIFQRMGTTVKPFEKSSTLIVHGLYRATRNPIYLGMVVSLIGIAVLAGSVSPFLVVPAFMYVIDRRFVRAEEAILEQTFGSQYAAYKASVRRWF